MYVLHFSVTFLIDIVIVYNSYKIRHLRNRIEYKKQQQLIFNRMSKLFININTQLTVQQQSCKWFSSFISIICQTYWLHFNLHTYTIMVRYISIVIHILRGYSSSSHFMKFQQIFNFWYSSLLNNNFQNIWDITRLKPFCWCEQTVEVILFLGRNCIKKTLFTNKNTHFQKNISKTFRSVKNVCYAAN